ncbi:hypothetical protein SAICODRAFT_27573 [Saitoella complicata NRRL Y-17804]|uniref:uncharacterized protein n=1 Tax=Saitoella complicata (strain BCRC 22490 / CBS 7301 / JCM 7358 / NBRC 10748 / NRRL Y-17804) TaxID=698492 RepID=UPI000866B266|nr:uncharacterized protein SAICODRAFT_27573 [Saitoella complicata NRRL Y-17804]ODQ50355.1 hypothetical protein SAICODRAFT_27573 [Saitoella complicata NRRL Y-17804]
MGTTLPHYAGQDFLHTDGSPTPPQSRAQNKKLDTGSTHDQSRTLARQGPHRTFRPKPPRTPVSPRPSSSRLPCRSPNGPYVRPSISPRSSASRSKDPKLITPSGTPPNKPIEQERHNASFLGRDRLCLLAQQQRFVELELIMKEDLARRQNYDTATIQRQYSSNLQNCLRTLVSEEAVQHYKLSRHSGKWTPAASATHQGGRRSATSAGRKSRPGISNLPQPPELGEATSNLRRTQEPAGDQQPPSDYCVCLARRPLSVLYRYHLSRPEKKAIQGAQSSEATVQDEAMETSEEVEDARSSSAENSLDPNGSAAIAEDVPPKKEGFVSCVMPPRLGRHSVSPEQRGSIYTRTLALLKTVAQEHVRLFVSCTTRRWVAQNEFKVQADNLATWEMGHYIKGIKKHLADMKVCQKNKLYNKNADLVAAAVLILRHDGAHDSKLDDLDIFGRISFAREFVYIFGKGGLHAHPKSDEWNEQMDSSCQGILDIITAAHGPPAPLPVGPSSVVPGDVAKRRRHLISSLRRQNLLALDEFTRLALLVRIPFPQMEDAFSFYNDLSDEDPERLHRLAELLRAVDQNTRPTPGPSGSASSRHGAQVVKTEI